jgi:hypothetical protein
MIKVILKGRLAARGDKDELFDPCGPRLVNGVLNKRAVNEGQDFFGDRLGRWLSGCDAF